MGVVRRAIVLGGNISTKKLHAKSKKKQKKKKLEKTVKCSKLKNKVVLMSLLITLNIFHIIFSVSIIDFEQVSVC